MEDEWIAFLRDKQTHFRISIELLQAKRIGTSEHVDGVVRDTTIKTLAQQQVWLAEIDNLLEMVAQG